MYNKCQNLFFMVSSSCVSLDLCPASDDHLSAVCAFGIAF